MQLNDPYSFHLEGTNGKGILLIHGLTGIPAEMKLVARQMHRQGYSVYAPLLAGHGVDVATLIQTGWQDWLKSVVDAAAEFRKTVSSVSTAGICVGGKLGMLAANQRPDLIQSTAIYSTCFRYDGWNVPWYYKLAPLGLPLMLKFPWWRHMTYPETESLGIKDARMREYMAGSETEGVIDQFPALSLLQMLRLGDVLKQSLPKLTQPALILHASEDDLSSPRNAKILARGIKAPHELHFIEDSYHMIHVDKHHRKVAAMTTDFFARHAVATA